VPRFPASPARPRALALLLALAIPLAVPPAGRSQDLVGCQLVEGTLQCVPGLTANPQQQIRILEGQINRDQALEGAVEQGIAGLRQLVLRGEAREGKLLQAWELIAGASGPSYTLRPGDVAYQVMVVVAVPSDGGSQRSASAPLGPVKAAAAAP
jgi:hypothetical protein